MLAIERDALIPALTRACLALDRTNIPILVNVMIDASQPGAATLTTTDMEIAVITSVTCTGTAPPFTLPAKSLLAAVKALPRGSMAYLDVKGPVANLTGAGGATFPTLPAKDFPTIALGEFSHTFTLPDLSAWLNCVRYAISTEAARCYLNGVYMHHVPDGLRLVASDGSRLAMTTLAMPAGAEGMPGVIIPHRTVDVLRKLTGPVAVQVSDTRVHVTAGDTAVVSKLIYGGYPEHYERRIPTTDLSKRTLTVDRLALIAAVKACKAVSRDRPQPIRFAMADGVLTLDARDQDGAHVTRTLPATWTGSGPCEIDFRAQYVLDLLAVCQGAEVSLVMPAAAVSEPMRLDDGNTVHALMRVRL